MARVVLISVGQLNNMANLLASRPDAISPLDGRELVRRKVAEVGVHGRALPLRPRGQHLSRPGPGGARHRRTGRGEIVFSGWEIGQDVLTGGEMGKLPASSPVRRAYELFNGAKPHKSWDQTAVWYGGEDEAAPAGGGSLHGQAPGAPSPVNPPGREQSRDEVEQD